MSPDEGALTQIYAGLDREGAPSGTFVGPELFVVGKAQRVVGFLSDSITSHTWPFSRDESSAMWEQSLKVAAITEFGKVI
jgi:hypothetical protein